jgi:protein ImuA
MQDMLSQLKAKLAALEPAVSRQAGQRFGLGCEPVDAALGGGLTGGALHEVFAGKTADAGTAAGLVAVLAMLAAGGRPVVWVRQRLCEMEAGCLHAPGLAALGLDPGRLILVRARDAEGVLRAGGEALRCSALGAVVLEAWGEAGVLDFTATRRLALAAGRSGVTCLLMRLAAEPRASAAMTRWQVAAAPSRALAANAPGLPVLDVKLLRQRSGPAGASWRLEWNHGLRVFSEAAPLSGGVAALPSRRPAQPAGTAFARTARTG